MWHVTKGKGSETPVPPQAVTQNGHLNNLCLRGKMVQVCVVESLCCSPETIITLLICYTPTQDKKLKKKSRRAQSKKKKTNPCVSLLISRATVPLAAPCGDIRYRSYYLHPLAKVHRPRAQLWRNSLISWSRSGREWGGWGGRASHSITTTKEQRGWVAEFGGRKCLQGF